MRVAFFGLPLAACLLHRDGHDLVYAGISRPEAPGTRRVRRLLGAARVFSKPNVMSPNVLASVRDAEPDLVVSWFWTTRLPPAITALARRGGIGVHPSLLPRHRGPDPYFWAIDAGDAITGVSAHRLAAEYDTGAILAQESLAIDPDWSAWTLAKKLDRPSLALLRRIVQAYARDEAPQEVPQDETAATLAPAPGDEDLEIDWTWTTERIARRVRAASPWPGAWTFFGDEAVTITRAVSVAAFPKALVPGEAAVVNDMAVVRTGDGALALVEGRMEGAVEEEPYELDAADLKVLIAELRVSSR